MEGLEEITEDKRTGPRPGWLERQFRKVEEDILIWPDWMIRESFGNDYSCPNCKESQGRYVDLNRNSKKVVLVLECPSCKYVWDERIVG